MRLHAVRHVGPATIGLAACSKDAGNSGARGSGAEFFVASCAGCHQMDGALPAFQPRAGSAVATGDPVGAVRIVKYAEQVTAVSQ